MTNYQSGRGYATSDYVIQSQVDQYEFLLDTLYELYLETEDESSLDALRDQY